MKPPVVVCLILLLTGNALSCIWDSDTIMHEASGIPHILETISGRFDRYPPKYYEMRRDRILSIIEADEANLDLYDDLAVAYDRLGDSTTAISWMKRKREQLDLVSNPEHEYRYLANLGTFYAHRWLKAGADLSDMADIDRAVELIEKCIELNPDAHFGREKYQLMVLHWLQSTSALAEVDDTNMGLPIVTSRRGGTDTKKNTPASEAVEGFSGLITLGAAWESVDIFQALMQSLQSDTRYLVAYLALLRMEELRDGGKVSLGGEVLWPTMDAVYDSDKVVLQEYFKELRAEAEAWRKQRTEYLDGKLSLGEHPDTHPGFWGGFVQATSQPKPPKISRRETQILFRAGLASAAVLVIAAFALIRILR